MDDLFAFYERPFDDYGNWIFNKAMFIDWQYSALDMRDDWEL